MEREKVTGVVIRERPAGDNDKLLTLLTAEHGKMIVTGKGVRSLKNKNMASTQMFCFSSFVITKNRGGFYHIYESDLLESFFGLRRDLVPLSLATYVCDVVDHCSVEDSGDVPLLRLLLNTLYAISSAKKPYVQIKGAFEMRCASVCGLAPDLDGCSVCGTGDAPMYYLDVLGGVAVCADCMSNRKLDDAVEREMSGEWTRPLVQLSPELLLILRHLVECDISRLLAFALPEQLEHDYQTACERYLLHHLGRGFDTLDFYKQITKM